MALDEILDRLAAFEPTRFPVLSLYLNTQPDQQGRARFELFVRKELKARGRIYPLRSSERESFDRDTERITGYLQRELRPSANGLAIFTCAGEDDFFEALQLVRPSSSIASTSTISRTCIRSRASWISTVPMPWWWRIRTARVSSSSVSGRRSAASM